MERRGREVLRKTGGYERADTTKYGPGCMYCTKIATRPSLAVPLAGVEGMRIAEEEWLDLGSQSHMWRGRVE